MKKLLVICGPTATGKTSLGINLAKKFDGEIISADSRQVYKGMDIGTGKDLPANAKFKNQNAKLKFKSQKLDIGFREKENIPIWLVDIVEPEYVFNVGEYARLANIVIKNIQSRNKLPIVVGGTGLYIRAITQSLPNISIPPNLKLRQRLERLNIEQLQQELSRVDLRKLALMNESDIKNPRRLIRAIEVVEWKYNSSSPPLNLRGGKGALSLQVEEVLRIGLTTSKEVLFQRIDIRVEERVNQGIFEEIKKLIGKGYKWDLPSMSGLGYQEWRYYFEHKMSKTEIIRKWKHDEQAYVKRQITWFKKEPNITWFDIARSDFISQILVKINTWYNSN